MKLDSVIVNINLACLLGGMDSAAILQHFRYWTNINASDPNMFRDGRVWVFASRKAIQNVFPCISDQRIRTILDKLVEGGYLIKGEYSLSMTSKATWFSLSDMAKSLFDGGLAPLVKSTNGLVKSTNDINNKENKKEYTIEEKRAILREKCEPYVGKYGREMIEAFLNYWGQANSNLILCEIAKRKAGAFDLPRRLATWAQNNYGKPNGPKPQAQPRPKATPSRPIWEEMGLTYEQYEKVVLKK